MHQIQQQHLPNANNSQSLTNSASDEHQQSYGRLAATLGGAALAIYGLTRGSAQGWSMAAAGGLILYRALNGNWPVPETVSKALPNLTDVKVIKSIGITKSADELYDFWRDFSNLPRFMKHLKSVEVLDETHSRWTATGPASIDVSWDAVITRDERGKMINWESTENADVVNKGTVSFDPAPGDRGTIVRVALHYAPPAGVVGATVAWLFGEEPNQQIEGDLRRFRNIMEAGEIPTTAGQPSGTRSLASQLMQPAPTKVQNNGQ